jgi:predicted peptidase
MKIFFITGLLTALITIASAQEIDTRIGEYSATSSVLELMGETSAQSFEKKIPINKPIEWEIYVPENYNPDIPAGVLVFINSRDSGKIEPGWKEVMERHNLIWIGANESGNKISTSQRVAYAILAPKLINNSYAINPERIYVSGFSGGGRVSSMVATEYNKIFKGAIYNSGANFWGEARLSRYKEMKNNYYVFITGTEDFNLEDTKEVYNAYKKAGVNNSKLIVIPNMAHKRPDAENLDVAIRYLDSNKPNLILDITDIN